MTTVSEIPHTACAVCGHVLNQRSSAFGRTWEHALEQDKDHPAVPVPVEEIRTIKLCDFCLEPDAAWILPAEDYRASPESESVGDWQCCAGCAAFLEKGDWTALTAKALAAVRSRGETRGAELEIFEAMYSQLREHITGPVRLDRRKAN